MYYRDDRRIFLSEIELSCYDGWSVEYSMHFVQCLPATRKSWFIVQITFSSNERSLLDKMVGSSAGEGYPNSEWPITCGSAMG